MKRFVCDLSTSDLRHVSSAGYTLVEMLVALLLISMLLVPVIVLFGNVSESVSESRSMIESAEQLRLAATRLQQDLAGATVTMLPPRKPEDNEGYFEYIEGPITAATAVNVAMNTDVTPIAGDSTVGDFDDILLFTTRSTGRPFVGKCGVGTTIQSDVAEVAWFLRGRTLHRRVLLVSPSATLPATNVNYYNRYDVSARWDGTSMIPNTLGDLTRREYRYAHTSAFPASGSAYWTWTTTTFPSWGFPTLPTLSECSASNWFTNYGTTTTVPNLDFWTNNSSYRVSEHVLTTGTANRIADDVILNNVIGFDVKAWDPGAPIVFYSPTSTTLLPGDSDYILPNDTGWGTNHQISSYGAYVDLGYHIDDPDLTQPHFRTYGVSNSGLQGTAVTSRTYDTFSTSYEGTNASNGLDDNDNGIVDDDSEKDYVPPYPVPLRGIQVKIRIFEPESRQVREVTVVQDFLPQ